MKRQLNACFGLFLGLLIGVPSIEKIFQIIFVDQFKSGNPYALLGLIPAFLLGLFAILNSMAIIAGYENLREAFKRL